MHSDVGHTPGEASVDGAALSAAPWLAGHKSVV